MPVINSRPDHPHEVLLVAGDDYTSLIRLSAVLHHAGCRVSLLAPRGVWVAETKYVRRRMLVGKGSVEVVEALRPHLAKHGADYRWIIPVDDGILRELVRRRNESWIADWFPVDVHTDAPELIVSKVNFFVAMTAAGVPMARSEVVRQLGEAVAAADRIGYPVMLKRDLGTAGFGVFKCNSRDELEGLFNEKIQSRPGLIQQFLPGRVGVTEALFDHGRPICWMSSYTPVTWPAPFGPSCVRQFMYHPEVENILRKIGEVSGIHGFGGFDFIHDPKTGRLDILEMHARATAGLHLGPKAGVDFVAAVRGMLAGEPTVQRPTAFDGETPRVTMFPQDFDRAVQQRDWGSLARWVSGKSGAKDIPWSDPRVMRSFARRTWRRESGEVLPRLARHVREPLPLLRRVAAALTTLLPSGAAAVSPVAVSSPQSTPPRTTGSPVPAPASTLPPVILPMPKPSPLSGPASSHGTPPRRRSA